MLCVIEATAAAGVGMVRAESIAPPEAAVTAAKEYLRIETAQEDALVARLVATAIGHAEGFIGSALLMRAMEQWFDGAVRDWQQIRRAPVVTIDAVEAVARDGSATALDIEAYGLDIDAGGEGWIRLIDPGAARRVRVRFMAGMAAEWEALPEAIAHGLVRLAAHFYANRDRPDVTAPAEIMALWWPWRRIRL